MERGEDSAHARYMQVQEEIPEAAAIALPILLALAFVMFSYRPPQVGLFRDGPTGEYGILEGYGAH